MKLPLLLVTLLLLTFGLRPQTNQSGAADKRRRMLIPFASPHGYGSSTQESVTEEIAGKVISLAIYFKVANR